jgi:hypothetical protein
MLVVSNPSPLSNLAIIDRLEILRGQFGLITIPPAVQLELDCLSHPAARARLAAAFRDGWVRVTPLTVAVPSDLAAALDPGEAEALALATQVKASLVWLDETAARLKATQLGLTHAGVLGILRWAKQAGQIASLAAEIRKLRAEARFFVNPALEKRLLATVGE